LGDSGFFIVRQAKIQYASEPQTHDFNTPYQLTMFHHIPGGKIANRQRESMDDYPEDAVATSHALHDGDVVLFATDGVSDNLSSQEILRIVSDEMLTGKAWTMGEAGISPSPILASVAASTNGSGI
jgi:protein phosphatase PTC7